MTQQKNQRGRPVFGGRGTPHVARAPETPVAAPIVPEDAPGAVEKLKRALKRGKRGKQDE
jgi:hypothetical protein